MKKASLLALISVAAGLVLASCGGTPTQSSSNPQDSSSLSKESTEPSAPSAESSVPSEEPSVPSEEPSVPSEEPSVDPSVEPSVDPSEEEVTYYLVGSFNSWTKSDDYAFSPVLLDGYEDKDMFALEITLAVGDAMKVTSSESVWYPDGMGNDYVVNEGGECIVYFCPEGGLEDDGFYAGFFKVNVVTPGEDNSVTMPVMIEVTNWDADTMQIPQLVWGLEAASNYTNTFQEVPEYPGVFLTEITFPTSDSYVCKVATWGKDDPWPEYGMFANEEGELATVTPAQDYGLSISGTLLKLTDGYGVGSFSLIPLTD